MFSSPKHSFNNKVAVVTGAGAGIGKAVSAALAEKGAHVAIISRNEERLQNLKKELVRYNIKVLALPLDVANFGDVEKAAVRVEEELGPIDIWVNNAMVSVFSPVKEMTAEDYKRVTDVTYLGVVYGTLAALKRMLPRNSGTIVQVGSALAYRGIPLQSAYCAAKHAIQGFHDSLLTELLHDKSKVKVTMVQLPAHNTPQFDWVKSRLPNKAQPVPPIYQPEVAAKAILWAACHNRREWIVGFSSWKAVYGNNFFPALADKFLARVGYKAQQTNEPRFRDQPNNLFESVPGPFGSHGHFDKDARKRSIFFDLTRYRRAIFILIAFILVIVLIMKLKG
ncbi:MAG TPA: SDR family oxidoreductase [Chitinophagaceae bacterium]|nr:SDR family oxidoreductase [Chitinophagaceae bacterium]